MVCPPAEYTPRDPSMWGSQPDPGPGPYYGGAPDRGPGSLGHRFSAPPPPLPPNTSRELISVPVNNGNHIVVGILLLLFIMVQCMSLKGSKSKSVGELQRAMDEC